MSTKMSLIGVTIRKPIINMANGEQFQVWGENLLLAFIGQAQQRQTCVVTLLKVLSSC